MKIFESLAEFYDTNVVDGRFDHDQAVQKIVPFITSSIFAISDLASGTGDMAGAAEKRWPSAKIHCEEPSPSMIAMLKKKYPHFSTKLCSLEETEILDQDLVMIAFNSINYVQPSLLLQVFKKIREGMRYDRIFYFDGMTIESAQKMLKGEEVLTRVRNRGSLKITTTLTNTQLSHVFTMENGTSEYHTQYLVSEDEYRSLLTYCKFRLDYVDSLKESLRTIFICRSE